MTNFSIIVPVYKTEKYLDKCIASILSQSYTDFELILVDDGSPDRCPQICDSYAATDDRVKVIHKENGGVSSARNCGIDVATGNYIWFVDSDDYIEPYSLEQLYKTEKGKRGDIYFFNISGKHELSMGTLDNFLKKYYFTYVVGFGPWNKLYKTSVIKENSLYFDTEETIGEDLLFNISYYKSIYGKGTGEAIFLIGQNYYVYVDRVGSAMNTASKGRIVQQMRLFDKIENMLSGIISKENMTYLFWLHLISGIGQSAQGGLTSQEFAESINFDKYYGRFAMTKSIMAEFFKNEHSSAVGRIRIRLFMFLMGHRKYRIAGRLMGLKK
ncbi:glycosyltransferase [Sellimonas catena]|uniref:Glycosyltransferase 2-like domain-containing protein n=1 Tax=Sellimonas catena TaxID=2994035 RepID=A0A9W6CGN7_9FIRM|nr:glycosyltransferase [Sellimonas catena]GLG91691.1 hypothetical protein Selli2_31180 [Sellimonas catena]